MNKAHKLSIIMMPLQIGLKIYSFAFTSLQSFNAFNDKKLMAKINKMLKKCKVQFFLRFLVLNQTMGLNVFIKV